MKLLYSFVPKAASVAAASALLFMSFGPVSSVSAQVDPNTPDTSTTSLDNQGQDNTGPTVDVVSPSVSPNLTVTKHVVGGTAQASDFSIHVKNADSNDIPGSPAPGSEAGHGYLLPSAGTYAVSEDANPDYTATFSGGCDSTGMVSYDGETPVTCTITNTFNSPPPTPHTCIVSDSKTLEGDDSHASVPVSPINGAWTSIASSTWIWGEDIKDTSLFDPTVDKTETFTRTFHVTGTPTAASLEFATDNGYQFSINGNPVGPQDQLDTELNYGASQTIDVTSVLIPNADNTLTVEVKNIGIPGSDYNSNPAGLLYKLSVTKAACATISVTNGPPPPPPPTTDVKICKLDENGNYLANWRLTLRKAHAVGEVNVPSDGTSVTVPNVHPGDYAVRATGTYVYRPGDEIASTSDAAYSLRDPNDGTDFYFGPYVPWVRENDFGGGFAGYLGVKINGAMTDWGSIFNPNPPHKYWTNVDLASTTNLSFNILDDNYSDNSGTIQVTVFPGYSGVTDNTGCVTFHNVPYGDYQIHEIHQDGWKRIDTNQNVTVNADHNVFNVVNDDGKGEPPAVTVIATKIICPVESDLPNLQGSSHSTDDETASDFLDAHPDCHIAPDWTFEYGNDAAGYLGGSYVGHDPNYTAFGPTGNDGSATVDIPLATTTQDKIEMREQLQNGYIPFSDEQGTGNNPSVSAELSCGNDGLNYDNWEWLSNPVANTTYYCVAWNVPSQQQENDIKVHINKFLDNGDGGINQIPDDSTAPNFPMHATWNAANIGSGEGDYTLGTNWGGATLRYAADTSPMSVPADYSTNEVATTTEGAVVVPTQQDCQNNSQYYLEGYKTGDSESAAEAADMTSDVPTFTGLTADKYVIVVNKQCSVEQSNTGTVTIVKNTTNEDGTFAFDVTKESDNSFQSVELSTTDHSATSDPVTVDANTAYDVTETVPTGWTLSNGHPDCVYDGESVGNPIDNGETVSVAPGQNATCTFTDTATTNGGGGGGGGNTGGNNRGGQGGGQVLGASTGQVLGAACGLYMDKHLRLGSPKNDPTQTTKLQAFLNTWEHAGLPMSGFYGPQTVAAVKGFQQHYASDILAPWGINAPTGIVYHTTLYEINKLECPELTLTLPPLIDWSQNPNAQ